MKVSELSAYHPKIALWGARRTERDNQFIPPVQGVC
jgi:hypothetical protein